MSDPERKATLLRAAVDRTGPTAPDDADWGRWVELAIYERVIPLLHRIVVSGSNGLSERNREAATAMQLDAMATAVRFEHDLLQVAGLLEVAGCEFAVLKGAATAHLDYPDPSQRQFGDIDLLVGPDDLASALGVLARAGWTQAYPLPRYHDRFAHAITLRQPDRAEIDLHQRVGHRAIGELIPTDEVLAGAVPLDIAGRRLNALTATDRMINAAIHAVTSRGPYRRLSSMADVLVMAEERGIEEPAVLERAERWRVRSILERAIEMSYAAALLDVPSGWRRAMQKPTTTRDRLVDRAYLSPQRRPATEELAFLRLMGSWSDRSLYLRGYFTTDDEYTRVRGRQGVIAQSRYLWARLRGDAVSPES